MGFASPSIWVGLPANLNTTMDSQRSRKTITGKATLKLHSANIRGLASNIDSVHHLLSSSQPSILFLTETQISGLGDLSYLHFPNYSLFHSFRLKGGVCAFVHSSLPVSPVTSLNLIEPDFQILWLKVCLSGGSCYFCCLYRSPNASDDSSLFSILNANYEQVLLDDPQAEVCFLGDFNVHNAEWISSSHTDSAGRAAEFFAISNSLTQLIDFPTHVPDRDGDTPQTLDLFLSSHPSHYAVSFTSPLGSADHVLIQCSRSVNPTTSTPPSRRTFWRYSLADWDGMRHFLSAYPWECCFSDDPSTFAERLTNVLKDAMYLFIPHFLKPGNSSSPDWFNHACSRAVSKKNHFFKLWCRNPTPSSRSNFVTARNACKGVIRAAKERFVSGKARLLADSASGCRSFWNMAKAVTRNFCTPSFPPIFDPSGSARSLPLEKAEIFASHFASVSSINPPSSPPVYPSCSSNFPLPTISTRDVRRSLSLLDPKKPPGPDGIPPIMLIHCAAELAPILCKLFRLSLSAGHFPTPWKCAHVLPIPKHGSPSDPNNYRPISITPILSKNFESLIVKPLLSHLESHSLLSDHQYGFRRNRSSGDLLAYVSHLWASSLDSFGFSDLVALDISKAFDRVWHADLLAKLPMYGLHPTLIAWVGSFLSDRSLQVRLDGVTSTSRTINAGVPQGSVLSPTLFLLYINDLLSSVSSHVHSFADDTTIHLSSSYRTRPSTLKLTEDHARSIDQLNTDLIAADSWGQSSGANFNALKSCFLSINRQSNFVPPSVSLGSCTIPNSSSTFILGILFSDDLSWSPHVKLLASRAAKKVNFLFRARRFFTPPQLLLLYKSFVRPTLEYCSHIWGGAPSSHLALLDSLQRKCVRLIDDADLTCNLHLLSHRRDVSCLSLFYRYYHGKCSSELASIVPLPISFQRSTRLCSSSHPYQVTLPRCRTVHFSSSFFPRTARLWNSLPLSVFPSTYNLTLFKSNVNAFLLGHSSVH